MKIDQDVDDVPQGASREWRVEEDMTPEQKKVKMDELKEMLNTAIKQSEHLRKANADSDTSATSQGKGSSSSSSSSSYSSTTDSDGKSTTDRSASYSTSSDSDSSSYKISSSSSSDGDVSLKENLQRWLEGEHVDWSSEYSSQFTEAQAAAEKLLKDDPAKAELMALESEKWLAHYLVSDLELMKTAREKGNQDPAVGEDKIERVQKMYDELMKRIEEREAKVKAESEKKGHDEL